MAAQPLAMKSGRFHRHDRAVMDQYVVKSGGQGRIGHQSASVAKQFRDTIHHLNHTRGSSFLEKSANFGQPRWRFLLINQEVKIRYR